MNYEQERMVAIEAVMKACCLCQTIRETHLPDEVQEKEDRSPVTIADLSAQAVISLDLSKVFPHDAIAAEEGLAGLRDDIKKKVVLQVKTFFSTLGTDKIFGAIERCTYEADHGVDSGCVIQWMEPKDLFGVSNTQLRWLWLRRVRAY